MRGPSSSSLPRGAPPLLEALRLPYGRIISILDRIVAAAGERLLDEGPFRAVLADGHHDQLVLLFRPVALLHLRREVVKPALAALAAHPSGEVRGDLRPVAVALLGDDAVKKGVLLRRPRVLLRVPRGRASRIRRRVVGCALGDGDRMTLRGSGRLLVLVLIADRRNGLYRKRYRGGAGEGR